MAPSHSDRARKPSDGLRALETLTQRRSLSISFGCQISAYVLCESGAVRPTSRALGGGCGAGRGRSGRGDRLRRFRRDEHAPHSDRGREPVSAVLMVGYGALLALGGRGVSGAVGAGAGVRPIATQLIQLPGRLELRRVVRPPGWRCCWPRMSVAHIDLPAACRRRPALFGGSRQGRLRGSKDSAG